MKNIKQEIWESPLPEDTRRRLSFLYSARHIHEGDRLGDIETNIRNAGSCIQRISDRVEQVWEHEANGGSERLKIADEVRAAISYLVNILVDSSKFDASWEMKDDIRALLDAEGPVPFKTEK